MREQKSGFPAAFLAGAVIVLLLVGGVYLLTRRHPSAPAAEPPLPMTPVEKAYAANIHFQYADPPMSRATNLLNQELTYLNGTLDNDGPRTIRKIEVTIEFRDEFGQLILREPRRIPGPNAAPIAPGEHRDFQFVFEHIPADWERVRKTPSLRVTGLLLE